MTVWDLPGPSAVADQIAIALRDGRACALAAPEGAELDGLAGRLARMGHEAPGRSPAAPPAAGDDPLAYVARLIDAPIRHADALAGHDAGADPVWVLDVPPDAVATWQRFLHDYAYALGGGHVSAAPLLPVIILRGGRPDDLEPRSTVELAWWWGVFSRLDVEVELRRVAPGLDHVRSACIAELAAFDLRLARWLASRDDLHSVNDWRRALCAYAKKHRLEARPRPFRVYVDRDHPRALHASWALGQVDRFCNEPLPFWHSALHAAWEMADREAPPTVAHRLGKAYVRSLFPRLGELAFELAWRARDNGVVPAFHADITALMDVLRETDCQELGTYAAAVRRLAQDIAKRRNPIAHFQVARDGPAFYEAIDGIADQFFATGPRDYRAARRSPPRVAESTRTAPVPSPAPSLPGD